MSVRDTGWLRTHTMTDDLRDSGREQEPCPPRFVSPFDGRPEEPSRERLEVLSTDPFDCPRERAKPRPPPPRPR